VTIKKVIKQVEKDIEDDRNMILEGGEEGVVNSVATPVSVSRPMKTNNSTSPKIKEGTTSKVSPLAVDKSVKHTDHSVKDVKHTDHSVKDTMTTMITFKSKIISDLYSLRRYMIYSATALSMCVALILIIVLKADRASEITYICVYAGMKNIIQF
jgi:hypothetical protein